MHWPNFVVCLTLHCEKLVNVCILIACFEINLIFLIKLFLYMAESQDTTLKYLENEKSF